MTKSRKDFDWSVLVFVGRSVPHVPLAKATFGFWLSLPNLDKRQIEHLTTNEEFAEAVLDGYYVSRTPVLNPDPDTWYISTYPSRISKNQYQMGICYINSSGHMCIPDGGREPMFLVGENGVHRGRTFWKIREGVLPRPTKGEFRHDD